MRPEIEEDLLTAYALGELSAEERRVVGAYVSAYPDARRYVEEVRETARLVADGLGAEPVDGLTALQHEVIEHRLRQHERASGSAVPAPVRPASGRGMRVRQWLPLAASLAASVAIVFGSLTALLLWAYPRPAATAGGEDRDAGQQIVRPGGDLRPGLPGRPPDDAYARDPGATNALPGEDFLSPETDDDLARDDGGGDDWEAFEGMEQPKAFPVPGDGLALEVRPQPADPAAPAPAAPAPNPSDAVATARQPVTSGEAEIIRPRGSDTRPVPPGPPGAPTGSPGSPGSGPVPHDTISVSPPDREVFDKVIENGGTLQPEAPRVYENPFRLASERPRSTFPVRVETASYKVVRNHLLERKRPPAHQVRIEELVNRFRYGYAPPADPEAALTATVEIAACPWDVKHRLARVAIKAREGGATVVARGVEVSVEFNPAATAQWRLIGYENAPAGEPGQSAGFAADLAAAGTATAFYEIVPAAPTASGAPVAGSELFTLGVRYFDPAGGAPQRLSLSATDAGHGFDRASDDFRFASAVAAFGMLLRDSAFKGTATYGDVIRWATAGKGADQTFERAAFIELVRFARDVK
jgi:hypothetical protein